MNNTIDDEMKIKHEDDNDEKLKKIVNKMGNRKWQKNKN